jgi:hypothetical protein
VYYPRSAASKSVQQLARNVSMIKIRELSHETAPTGEKVGRDLLLASSHFG